LPLRPIARAELPESISQSTADHASTELDGERKVVTFLFADIKAPLIAPEDAQAIATIVARVAQQGEPFVTRFAPEELTAKLKAAGFSDVVHFSPEAAFDRYFAGRQDALGAPTAGPVQLLRAIV